MRPNRRAGFTLIELIVVVLILAVLAGVLVPRVSNRLASARDTRRMEDITALRDAIEQYFLDEGSYPAASSNASFGGWDVSHDGDLIPNLVKGGYLKEVPADPLNDDTYHYRYYVYSNGSYGCVGSGSYYVLGIKNFETQDFATKNTGYFKCTGRDWNTEFDFVTGGGASYQ
ncbi:MAG: prepilin-type N-terminal cleavage/methylation domain-containing protein [Planctomycetes bacterium]|nr:prepilin-type N-terminal cleavage/methylation domain-containing protein [Planctomycetota bacterium]